ncbi:sensor histidine kinase [Clostridium sp. ZS2-4]|uniref:sensor histidine kinase n=1 Tax=Clostridium sp. ZS2-4 TaxID=2987703 RepID=UPI00227A87B4|nr:ATP-binding protein [Clostridium sp. ZS2-4]MCY6354978.1 ATP-binding protein [Clostridium sp. ZS2-4]
MTTYKFIAKFINSALEAVPILLMYLKVLQKEYYLKEHKLKIGLYILIHAIFSAWAIISISNGGHTLAIIIFSIMVMAILTSTALKYSAVAALISYIYIIIIEVGCITIFSILAGKNSILLLDNIKIDILFALVLNLIRVSILAFMHKTKINFIKFPLKEEEDNITSYWIFGIFIMLICLISVNNIISNKINVVIYQVLVSLLLLFFIFIGMIDYRKRMELNKIKNKFELKKEYANNLESIIDIIRREKHDFANHINTIYAMCILNRPDTLECIKNYLRRTTNNLETAYKFFDTGNDYIDGLIAMKSNLAFENDIYLDVDFEISLDVIMIDDYELVGIISNILDNAFQCFNSEKHDEKKIISVYGYVEEGKYYLSIANNGPMIPKNKIDKIFNKGFTTKKDDKKDHGFGLFIVNSLMKKNGGKVSISSSPEETEFLLEFKLKEDSCEETG